MPLRFCERKTSLSCDLCYMTGIAGIGPHLFNFWRNVEVKISIGNIVRGSCRHTLIKSLLPAGQHWHPSHPVRTHGRWWWTWHPQRQGCVWWRAGPPVNGFSRRASGWSAAPASCAGSLAWWRRGRVTQPRLGNKKEKGQHFCKHIHFEFFGSCEPNWLVI